jgi:hypothetical protein
MVLHPTYTLRVEVRDRLQPPTVGQQGQLGQQFVTQSVPFKPHKYWDGLAGKSGRDEVLAAVRAALRDNGIDAEVSLERFEHKA